MTDTRRIVIGAAACIATLAGTALAQARAAEQEGRIRFEGQPSADGTKVRQHVIVRQVENGREVTIEVKDGRTTATIDGKPVPQNRIRRNDAGLVELMDENGNVITAIAVGDAHAFAFTDTGEMLTLVPRFNIERDTAVINPDGTTAFMTRQPEMTTPPPVMVGITMAEPGESIREHFGLAEGEGILIASVRDGTPAAQAGLKPHDVVILIDGQKPATQERLRELLRSRKPGDTLNLTILQAGQKKDVKVVLAPYDPERLGIGAVSPAVPTVPGAPAAPGAFWGERITDAQQLREMAMKLRERMGDLGAEMTPEIRREVDELVKRLTEDGAQLRNRFYDDALRWEQRIAPPAQGGRVFVQPTPATPPAPDRATDERLTRLEERLDRLERSIDRLVNALERDRERNR